MNEEEVYQKIKEELQTTEWEALRNHLDREALVLCKQGLDLAYIGKLLALDQVDEVKELMAMGSMQKLPKEAVDNWKNEDKFLFVIIQPFVLIQELQ